MGIYRSLCIPLTKTSSAELWYFLCCTPEQIVEQTVEWLVIPDAACRSCDITVMYSLFIILSLSANPYEISHTESYYRALCGKSGRIFLQLKWKLRAIAQVLINSRIFMLKWEKGKWSGAFVKWLFEVNIENYAYGSTLICFIAPQIYPYKSWLLVSGDSCVCPSPSETNVKHVDKWVIWLRNERWYNHSSTPHNVPWGTHDAIMTLFNQTDVAPSFWLNDDVIITWCVRWGWEIPVQK